ncbi:peptidoglycan DD-metalloendopeptidase family protein [Pseudobacteriovorax antillogorgiicola]|uniref:Murein DD-endopeptidase MepM and murein hydrolase activator NlpD, contain LysM domain n=1 Tax=Pseudobacteriovorax antillogorgiicola TaxID=1513793 RepID=A0A1Y6CMS5_9BACT|nr:M23 family metallopeptidase [Pseudobacteriovorax antillogorgiicola]TCS44784.1 murein DD-endopeptidase MepM/ murein hydrolase activator NlpD [Pseudobacteriovorax antillogorgiicola]SMF77480.1 Murein DD-endopeptidase MepM and murein hydrolase activator NlpD, contain LysM domain [Pseudobacteriovorax antillogorgiicola]
MKLILIYLLATVSVACSHTGSTQYKDELGDVHKVKPGETLSEIAEDYDVSWRELAQVNDLGRDGHIQAGQQIIVPVRNQSLLSSWIKSPLQCHENHSSPKTPKKGYQHHDFQSSHDHRNLFSWPVRGRLTSVYGPRGGRIHQGIDIAAPTGTNIRASAQGTVVFSGWLRGYGRTVIIQHKGYRTLYAHCHRLLVRRGQRVATGKLIALVGSSGRSTGPHLHFEIQRGMAAVNPLKHLGSSIAGL